MSQLLNHIAEQQVIAQRLSGVLAGLEIVDDDGGSPDAVAALIRVGRELVGRLTDGLDIVNPPDEGDA